MANDWDGVLKEAFGRSEDQSVLESIERSAGIRARILLHDTGEETSPILRVGGHSESAEDDSRYQILGEIARGGVGIVFKARDKNLGRSVALKVLRPRHADNAEVVQRFLEEAQIGGQLQHPGIVPIYGLGLQDDGRPYFAMKLIKGETLSVMLTDRASPDVDRRRFLGIFEQICQTLAYAHSRGVVHRDLKPANVMVGNFGEVQVVDWGFAKVLGRDDETQIEPDVTMIATVRTGAEGSQSIAGSVMGTPAYMPPEQALGQIDMLDERSDVFALGAVLCELLTGKPPYVGEINDQLLLASQARLDDAHQRLDACGADAELVALCKKSMAPTRGERPRNAAALAAGIGEHLSAVEERARAAEVASAQAKAAATEQQAAERQAQLDSDRARVARRRVMTLTAAVLLVAVGAGITYSLLDGARRERETAAARAVTAEIGKARRLQGAGEWDEAQRAATGAVALAKAGRVDDATTERAAATLREVEHGATLAAAEAERLKRNREFLARLEEVREGTARYSDLKRSDAAYVEAFGAFGLDPDSRPQEAIELLKKRGPDPVRVANALDLWAVRRKYYRALRGKNWRPLHTVARAIDPDPLRNRLRSVIESGEYERAHELVEEAREAEPATVILLVRVLWFADLNDEVFAILEPRVLRYPSNFWLRYMYGTTLNAKNRWNEAIRHLQAAIALRPESGGAWNNLGLCFAGVRDWEETERCYLRSEEIAGVSWRSLENRGYAYGRQGRNKEAIELLRRAEKMTEHQADVPMWLGIHLTSDDRMEEALHWSALAVERQSHWNTHRNHARLLLRFGRLEEASVNAHKARELNPEKVDEEFAALPERMIELQPRLEELLGRQVADHSTDLLLDVAQLCFFLRRYEDAVHAYQELGRRDAEFGLQKRKRYRPAQCAVRAADRASPARAKELRDYALTWLQRELVRSEQKLEGMERMERFWLGEDLNWCRWRICDLKGVRVDVVDQLPPNEREAWAEFWGDADRLMWRAWENIGG